LKNKLLDDYRQITLRYLEKEQEALLYNVSMLSKKFIAAEIGPDELIQHHFKVVNEIIDQHDVSKYREITLRLSHVLFESIMVYSQAHQEVRDLLNELKQRYLELERAKIELERTGNDLREKTALLLQTEKMTALGELAAGVAHELNQPLNVVRLISEDMYRDIERDRSDMDEIKSGLQEIVSEITRMADIINHMRIFTRKTTDDQYRKISATVPIDGVFKLLGQQLRVQNIDVTKEISEGLFVYGNPIRIEQVMMNLITNARDAVRNIPQEKKRMINIKVYKKDTDQDTPTIVYEIRDNGTGISDTIKDKIFEPFFTQKAPGEGTGLGLSVANQIVKEHKGRIEVISEKEEGTLFRIMLPAYISKSDSE